MLCDICKKRIAMIFITKIDGNTSKNEGICLICAKKLGIKPASYMFEGMGLTDDDIENMTEEISNLAETGMLAFPSSDSDKADAENDKENGDNLQLNPRDFINNFFKNAFNSKNDDKNSDAQREKVSPKNDKDKKNTPKKKNIESFCIDLTERARMGRLDKIIGREKELDRVMQILSRRQKNNPCLIGEPGVGKTAIAEALALKIALGTVPARLADKEVHLLDMTGIVAGTQFRGQFESRMKGLIEEVRRLGNIILVIDEVHTIVGAGDAEGSMNAANILKPALSRGDIQVIGATTLGEYRRYIEKDSALERRFQPIIVNEPSIDESIEMLMGVKGYYEKFHGIKIPSDTVKKSVLLSERYITDRFLPDKAIDLLDESCAYVTLNSPIVNRVERLAECIDDVSAKIDAIEQNGGNYEVDYPKSTEIYQKLADLKTKKLNYLNEFSQASKERDGVELTVSDLAHVIEKWTDIPASSINEDEFERLSGLQDNLNKRIIGQDEAIKAAVRAVKRNRMGISYKRKPVSFIFAGPTGVGKTELVKTLASELFNSVESLIRLDMSEFMEKFSVSRIIGAPPGYVGYDEAGQLTEKIRRKPYSVILFDEIEKAHPDVMNILLQVLDDGRITDAQGRDINFENTIIVMTTNAGSNLNMSSLGFTDSAERSERDKTQKALSDFLRPEFLNRVDEIITFRSLDEEDFVKIASIMLADLRKSLDEKNIRFNFTHAAARVLAMKAYSKKYGARNLRRLIQTDVEDPMANMMIDNKLSKNITFSLDSHDDSSLTLLFL